LNYAGREIYIVASASSEGGLLGLLGRGSKTITLPCDPREYGLAIGSYIERDDGLMLAGRVTDIRDNDDKDNWFNFDGATEWYVTIERPWKQTMLATSLGQCKVEWLEDTLFPRVGRILSTPEDSYFRLGDMVRVSCIGSRNWTDLQAVSIKLNETFNELGQFIVVSGGADGPSKMAETTAQEFGFPVISFRPVKIAGGLTEEDEFGVDEWRLYRGGGQVIHHREPTWADWRSAAGFRSLLIAERADYGFAWWDGQSHGTSDEIDYFASAGKPLEVFR
jgi:hypothetical protein